jgi:hypothetical protein
MHPNLLIRQQVRAASKGSVRLIIDDKEVAEKKYTCQQHRKNIIADWCVTYQLQQHDHVLSIKPND